MTLAEPRVRPALPAPVASLEAGLACVAEHGLAILPDVLAGAQLEAARSALYRAAAHDRARGREQKFALDYAGDETNQRVWNLLSRDPVFADLAEHPTALAFVRASLGWPALLGNISANITGPGGGEMVLHADQIFVPEPWAPDAQGLNVCWCLDDFTEATGATRIVPGSHRLNRAPRPDEAQAETLAVEAPPAPSSCSTAASGTRPATTAPPIAGGQGCSPGTRGRSIASRRTGSSRWTHRCASSLLTRC